MRPDPGPPPEAHPEQTPVDPREDPDAPDTVRRRAAAALATERRIADRFALLHAASAALAAAVTPADVAGVLASRGLALPAARGCLVVFAGDGPRAPAPGPLRAAAFRGEGVTLPDAGTFADPAAAGRHPLARALAMREAIFPALAVDPPLAALPLLAGQRLLGAVALAFAEGHAFEDDERAFLEAFAHQGAQALDRARLYEAERAARIEAQRAEEAARRAVELQQLLVGVVGHDLRTPLSAIRMGAALIARRGGLRDDSARTLARVLASAARMTSIIRDLLDFTRVRQEGAIPVELEPLDLAELARRAVAELQAVHPDRAIRLDTPPSLAAFGDPERLHQVLSNLVGNALQHGPATEEVRVLVRGEGASLLVEVHNAGAPIPEPLRGDLWAPFRRGGHARDPTGSVGLGLYIVREVVLAHGGEVAVRSVEGEGTTFTVRLPAAPGDRARGPVDPTGRPAPEG